MKYSTGKVLISVICFIMGAIFLITGVMLALMGKVNSSIVYGDETEGSSCSVTVRNVEEIGDEYSVVYGDETITYTVDYADYSIYEITFSVWNEGVEELYSADPGIFISGEDYSDVYEMWISGPDYDETPLFYYESEPYVPAYCVAEVKYYVQVRDGVTELTASYYPSYDSEEMDVLTISL